jgi:hypothetical protein
VQTYCGDNPTSVSRISPCIPDGTSPAYRHTPPPRDTNTSIDNNVRLISVQIPSLIRRIYQSCRAARGCKMCRVSFPPPSPQRAWWAGGLSLDRGTSRRGRARMRHPGERSDDQPRRPHSPVTPSEMEWKVKRGTHEPRSRTVFLKEINECIEGSCRLAR